MHVFFSVILRDNDPTNPFSLTTILLSIKRILNLNPPPPPPPKKNLKIQCVQKYEKKIEFP